MKWEKLKAVNRIIGANGVEGEGAAEVVSILGPGRRWGHTCNAIKDGEFIYVFGGYGNNNCQTNQVHVFDTAPKKMRWQILHPQVEMVQEIARGAVEINGPGKRCMHTCNAVRGGEFLYVFGGYGRDLCRTNKVHIFNTARQTWNEPVIKGTPPSPRDSHSCTAVGDNLFVFGGTDGMNPLRDLHILDTSSHTWRSPSVRGEGPQAREGHSAALVGKELFIFGGCGKSSDTSKEVYYNDVYILDTGTLEWRCAPTSGTLPSARDSHTLSSWQNNIILIGGEDEIGSYLSDVYILDTGTLTWRILETSGKLPPRAGHSTVALGKNLFVFGGFTDDRNLYEDLHMLDVETGFWAKVTATGDVPSARFSVAGDCLYPGKGGVLVFIGGCNMHLEPLDDMLFLHTGLITENRVGGPQRVEKLSMRKQLRLKSQGQQHSANIGTSDQVLEPTPISVYGQPSRPNPAMNGSHNAQGKRTFNAKVVDLVPEGAIIETVLDGMLLRGVVFSNKKNLSPRANEGSSRRKRVSKAATHDAKLNNGGGNIADAAGPSQQNSVDCMRTDGVHGNESAKHDHQADLPNSAPSDATHSHEVPGNPSPLASPGLNLDNDVVMHDAPNSGTEVCDEIMTTTATMDAIFSPNQVGAELT